MPSLTPLPTSSDAAELAVFPFEEQEPFLESEKRYYGYVSGVGAGKTHAGMLRTAWNMMEWNPGEMGAIVAPTTTMVKNVILPLMRTHGFLEQWEYRSKHTNEPGLHAPNGSRALILSAENRRNIERLAGLNLSWWWLDEGSRTPPRALEILEQRLRVGQYKNGYVTTTPMGQDHIYDFFVGNHDGERVEHGEGDVYHAEDRTAILHVPTWANPFTDDEYDEQMRSKEGQTYEREVLGRFVDYEGLVYTWFDHDTHLISASDVPESAIRETIYGVDWGFNNPAVIVVIARTANGEYYVLDEFYGSGQTVQDLVDVAQGLQDRYGAGRVYCDPAEPDSIEAFQRAGLDATGADNDILPGVQHVSSLRDELWVVDGNCQQLVNEFGLYRYPDSGDGETPVDANNHALDAARYALYTHERKGGWSVGVAFG